MVVFGPQWFFGVDMALELVFAIITLGIAAFSYRLAKIVKNKNFFHFTAGFLLLSAGYGVRTLINLLSHWELIPAYTRYSTDWIYFAGFYLSSILFIAGTVMLLSTTFSKTRDIRPTIMIFLSTVVGFIFSWNKPVFLWIITSLFLLLICYHYLKNFVKRGKPTTFATFIAFGLLLVGQVNFLFRFHKLFYVIGHSFELAGFLILLGILYHISRK